VGSRYARRFSTGGDHTYRNLIHEAAFPVAARKEAVMLSRFKTRTLALYAMCVGVFAALVAPVAAFAVESEAEKKVKEVTVQVSSEGVNIIIAVLAGLVALIALSIVLPKAIGFIRRFV
jgi:hypothetical protein